PSIATAGKAGGGAPLAMTCSGLIVWVVESKQMKLPVRTLVAPTLNRICPALMRSKSIRLSKVLRSFEVSYQLVASVVPDGKRYGGIIRGSKKLGAPRIIAVYAANWLNSPRAASPTQNSRAISPAFGRDGVVTSSQKARNLSNRRSRGLPAIKAAVHAPHAIAA